MYLSKWNIGLEIHHNYFVAVAIQKKRYGWQLRGWWQVPLPQSVYNQQGLFNPTLLIDHLRQWRKLLPKWISLRLTLPTHLVLQRPLALPNQPLLPQELDWYVEASVNKLFPLAANELAIDYRTHTVDSQPQLLITATRQTEMQLWLNTLSQAGLKADVIDIAPCILRAMAHLSAVPADNLLIHKMADDYLLVSPLKHDFYFEHLIKPDWLLPQCSQLAQQHYLATCHKQVNAISISGDINKNGLPAELHYWSPFAVIQQIQPPIPPSPATFAIACGLALRELDHVAG